MKIYLAGPMKLIKDHNHPAFHAAAARIRARGYECINPAELNPLEAWTAKQPRAWWLYCMHRDLPHVVACDAIALLPNWLDSEGTRLEIFNVCKLGKPILEEATWTALSPYICLRQILLRELLAFPPDTLPAPSTALTSSVPSTTV